MLSFWNNVKNELDYKLMSQKELAALTGISYNTLQSWITKDRLPDAEDSVKIAQILDVSVEYLVTGVENTINHDDDNIKELIHDIKHLSSEDLNIAKIVVRRMTDSRIK